MFWMHAYPLLGQVRGGWALELSSFLGPKWHTPFGSMPFDRAQKTQLVLVMDIHASKTLCTGLYKS